MSSTLFISGGPESDGTLFVDMPANGSLFITADGGASTGSAETMRMPPDAHGIADVERLIVALQEWVRHTKETL